MKFEKFVAMMDAVVKKYPSLNSKEKEKITATDYGTEKGSIRCQVCLDKDGNISAEQTPNMVAFSAWG